MTPRHIAIVGYGTAGQAAAVLLSRDGHRVEVFEQAPQPGPVGAGFLLQPTGLQVLWSMGLLDAALAHGAPVRRLYGETPRGRGVMDMRYSGLDARLRGLGMQRGALFTLLAQAWPGFDSMHRGTRIAAIDGGTHRIRDAEGRWHGPFDMIIVADGSASALRSQVAVAGLDRPYPWGALWCLVPRGDWAWADELRQRYVAARRMIGLLPVGTRPGDDVPRLSFFWGLPTSDFDAWKERGLQTWLQEIEGIWPQVGARLEGITDASQLARAIVLRHEITHVALGAPATTRTPTWLEEGLAEYLGYRGSGVPLRSGMVLQVDIIPATGTDHFTTNIEDGIALADEALRDALADRFPDAWQRITARREFMVSELGFRIAPEVLPLSDMPAYLPPFLLRPDHVMTLM